MQATTWLHVLQVYSKTPWHHWWVWLQVQQSTPLCCTTPSGLRRAAAVLFSLVLSYCFRKEKHVWKKVKAITGGKESVTTRYTVCNAEPFTFNWQRRLTCWKVKKLTQLRSGRLKDSHPGETMTLETIHWDALLSLHVQFTSSYFRCPCKKRYGHISIMLKVQCVKVRPTLLSDS